MRSVIKHQSKLSACLAALLLCGCAGQGAGSPAPAAGDTERSVELSAPLAAEQLPVLPAIPAPKSLVGERTRAASYAPEDLLKEAEDFSPLRPNNLAAATASGAAFSPTWATGQPFGNLAYATYAFELEGYDLNAQLRFGWITPPDTGSMWVALSDWQQNRWKWYKPAADAESLNLASLEPFISGAGDMLVVVLFTGTEQSELDWLRAGTEFPLAAIEVSGPRAGFGELETSFDASASTDPDGNIVKYDWDWNGDGSFDNTTGSNPQAEHTFTEAGSFNVAVRVTDNRGARSTASVVVSVASEWSRTLGGSRPEEINDVGAAPDGTVWACGFVDYSQGDILGSEMQLLQFAADGELLREIYWIPSDEVLADSRADKLEIDSAGNVYVLGGINAAGSTGTLLQRWNSSGELIWSRVSSGADGNFRNMRLINDQLYLCGGKWDLVLNAERAVYTSVDLNGVGGSGFLSTENASLQDVMLINSVTPEMSGLRFCGHCRDEAFDYDLLHVHIPDDGSGPVTNMWGSDSITEFAVSIRPTGTVAVPSALISVTFSGDTSDEVYVGLVRHGIEDTDMVQLLGEGTGCFGVASADGQLYALGSSHNGRTALIPFNSVPNYEPNLTIHSSALISLPRSITPYAGTALLIGGSLPSAGGEFGQESISVAFAASSTWTDYTLTFADHPLTWTDTALPNFAQTEPGLLDSGGGSKDAWVSLHDPAQP